MFAKTTWVRFNVTQDKRDPEEKRLGDELTAACAEMGMYVMTLTDHLRRSSNASVSPFADAASRGGRRRSEDVLGPVGFVLTSPDGPFFLLRGASVLQSRL